MKREVQRHKEGQTPIKKGEKRKKHREIRETSRESVCEREKTSRKGRESEREREKKKERERERERERK